MNEEKLLNGGMSTKHKNCYDFIESQDDHIINIMRWLDQLGQLEEHVRNSDMDRELTIQLRLIYSRLIRELGERIHTIL